MKLKYMQNEINFRNNHLNNIYTINHSVKFSQRYIVAKLRIEIYVKIISKLIEKKKKMDLRT